MLAGRPGACVRTGACASHGCVTLACPSLVRLRCSDKAGEGGASLLAPDELLVQLLPGPAAALVADCPQQLECSTRGWLDMLPVKAVDAFGNPVEDAAFEVRIAQSCADRQLCMPA